MRKHYLILILLFLFVSHSGWASHMVGGYASYTCLGGNKYRMSYTYFFECGGITPSGSDWFNYKSMSGCGPTLEPSAPGIMINYKSMVEYSTVLLCASMASNNNCTGGSNPNFGIIKYDTVLTLPNQCDDWVFYYPGGGQVNYNFTNISGKPEPGLYTWIDNTNGMCNNSVLFDDLNPIVYTCTNNKYSFPTGAYDPDGDSLIYHIVPGVQLSGNMTYVAPWSGTDPITGITIDTLTGVFTFIPNTVGKFWIAINVDEYDRTTKKIKNSTIRQSTVIVQACSNNPPDPTTGVIKNLASPAVKTGSYSIDLSEGDSLSFQATVNDSDVADVLSVYASLAMSYLPGSKITTSGANPITITVKWKAPSGSAGNTIQLPITVTDNSCPTRAQTTYMYTINIKGKSNNTKASPDVTICKGKSTQLSASGGAMFTWTVLAGEAINKGTNFSCNPCSSPVASPTISTTYIVTSDLTSNNKDTVVVTVNPAKNATITPKTFCSTDSPANLSAVNSGGTWTGKGITNASNGTFSPSIASLGTHSITYTISGLCGDTDTENIIVTSSADATITLSGTYCESDAPVNLTAANTGGTWSGKGITNSTSGTFSPSVAGYGTHTVTYTISGSCGDTDTEDIIVNKSADATITSSGPYCESDSIVTLIAATSGGIWSGNGITNTSTGTFSPITAGLGTHTITYTIGGACGDTDTEDFIVTNSSDATITPVGTYCDSDAPVNLTAVNAGGAWTGKGITSSSLGTFSPSVAGGGTHAITYTISGSCGDTAYIDVVVLDTPIVSVIATPITCSGNGCDGTATVGASPYIFLWDDPSVQTTSTATGLCSGSYSVTVTDTTNGCTSTSSATVGDAVLPTAFFVMEPQPTTTTNTTITFTDLSVDNIIQWNWTFMDVDSSILGTASTKDTTFLFPEKQGIYPVRLQVKDATDCMGEVKLYVIINNDFVIYIPNAFTPNGDGLNDAFYPEGSGINPAQYSFYVYNRWGELIFQATEIETHWDGTYNGSVVKEGVYVWKLLFKDETPQQESHEYHGHVVVVR